jgi:hypothetical protein
VALSYGHKACRRRDATAVKRTGLHCWVGRSSTGGSWLQFQRQQHHPLTSKLQLFRPILRVESIARKQLGLLIVRIRPLDSAGDIRIQS